VSNGSFRGKGWRNQRDAWNAENGFVKSEWKQPAKIDPRTVPLGLNSKLQWLHGPCVKDGGQKLEKLVRKVGCKHEERSNANLLRKLLRSSCGSNEDHWCKIFGLQWNVAASQNSSADSKLEGTH